MADFLSDSYARLRTIVSQRDAATLPLQASLDAGAASLPQEGDPDFLAGRGTQATVDHLLGDIVPALNGQNLSARYFGFVTGGTLPVAEAADNIVTALDQNVQVHLPDQTVSTAVEDAALRMLLALLELGPPGDWQGRTFTTGATGSNTLGLTCGREAVVAGRLDAGSEATVAKAGLLGACLAAGVNRIQVLTSMGHSSLSKAASIVGIGHDAVVELPASDDEPWRLDLDAVERELARDGVANIIVVSAGEVNTGRFATNALDMPKLRSLADRYRAWIHVDGAFGLFARALPRVDEFLNLRAQTAGLELADSIAADGHKLLNVPYDAGVFLCRNQFILSQAFANPNAAYLSSKSDSQIPSPLNVGLENSRRFRALPVYAVLMSEGRDGMAQMLARQVKLARSIAEFVRDSEDYEWLPDQGAALENTHIVVLFRAKDPGLNDELVTRINQTRRMYVSGTKWKGRSACRLAVGSWRVDVGRDFAVVKEVLTSVAKETG